MGGGSVSEEECCGYVRSLPILPKVLAALPLLMKPPCAEVVETALEKVKGGPAMELFLRECEGTRHVGGILVALPAKVYWCRRNERYAAAAGVPPPPPV
jgi:hypothetical protein